MEACMDARTARKFLQQKCGRKLPGSIPFCKAERTMASLVSKCQRSKGHQLTVCERDKELLGRIAS